MRRALGVLTLAAIITARVAVVSVVGFVLLVGGYATWALWCAESWVRESIADSGGEG